MANSFTPQEIEEFLQEFFDVVGTRQYIGARYVPMFGRRGEDSIEWDDSAPYEPLTIVTHQGNSYTSRTYVPAGVAITDGRYWVLTGAYNAQVEAYRQEVVQLQADWGTWKDDTEDDLDTWKSQTVEDFEEAIGNVPNILPSSAFSTSNTVKSYIDNMAPSLRRGVMVVLGDSWSDASNDPTYPWMSRVATALGMPAWVTNAMAGMGWAYGTTTIPAQVAGAVDKVTAAGHTAADVTLLIAFGGVNDYRHGMAYGDTAAGMRSTFTNARASFPNAKILLICGNTGKWDTMDELDTSDPNKATSYAGFPSWIANLQRNVQNSAPEIASASFFEAALWLNSYGSSAASNIWNTDTLHPLQIGHNIIAQNIIQMLCGNTTKQQYSYIGTLATPQGQPTITDIPLNYTVTVENLRVTMVLEGSNHSASDLPGTLTWNPISTTLPRICGGTNNPGYRIPVTAWNFSGNGLPIRGYWNAATNVLTLYPASANNRIDNLFCTFTYSLM